MMEPSRDSGKIIQPTNIQSFYLNSVVKIISVGIALNLLLILMVSVVTFHTFSSSSSILISKVNFTAKFTNWSG